jgi:hypothetical protein
MYGETMMTITPYCSAQPMCLTESGEIALERDEPASAVQAEPERAVRAASEWRFKCTSKSEMAAGVMPGTRAA